VSAPPADTSAIGIQSVNKSNTMQNHLDMKKNFHWESIFPSHLKNWRSSIRPVPWECPSPAYTTFHYHLSIVFDQYQSIITISITIPTYYKLINNTIRTYLNKKKNKNKLSLIWIFHQTSTNPTKRNYAAMPYINLSTPFSFPLFKCFEACLGIIWKSVGSTTFFFLWKHTVNFELLSMGYPP
jgi:hypothetical protein